MKKNKMFFNVILIFGVFFACTGSPTPVYTPAAVVVTEEVNLPGTVYNVNGHRYMVVNESRTWNDANSEAEKRGGYLATISDADEQRFIENLINENGDRNHYWLGGYRNSTNEWVWVDGTQFNYTNWASGRPDNFGGREDKLIIARTQSPIGARPGQWDDVFDTINTDGDSYWRSIGFIIEWTN